MSSPSEPMSGPMSGRSIDRLIAELDSLLDGERAAAMLVALGEPAIPYLSLYLLHGARRTISLPRCRAVHALGELGAHSTLLSYLRESELAADAPVLFAEDAVRSAAAEELLRWKTEETFLALLDAAKVRATGGIVRSLGEFQRPESVPVLFEILEDDLCREDAKESLRKAPSAVREYAVLLMRGQTSTPFHGPSALRRRRATLQLLAEVGVSPADWQEFRHLLEENDPEVVVDAASIGIPIAPDKERTQIFEALFRVSKHANWVQEDTIAALLDKDKDLASKLARALWAEHCARGESPDGRNPFWRILRRTLKEPLQDAG